MRDDDVRTSSRGSPVSDFGFAVDPAAEQITRGIEQDIFRVGCGRGEKLREEELAERFDASRHSCPGSSMRLAQTVSSVKERNRALFVRRVSADEVRQINEIS